MGPFFFFLIAYMRGGGFSVHAKCRWGKSTLTRSLPFFFFFLRRSFSQNRLADIKTHCLEEFRRHWACLDNNNHQLWQCRRHERPFNACVYDKLVRQALRNRKSPSALPPKYTFFYFVYSYTPSRVQTEPVPFLLPSSFFCCRWADYLLFFLIF